jgi:hypothetical protein
MTKLRLPFSGLGTNGELPMPLTMPFLSVTERAGTVCLQLGGFARGEGPSLQEAGDDLICRLLGLAMALRSSGFRVSPEVMPDLEAIRFLHEVGELAAAGGDVRAHVFG